ncbi:hypothetical protein [Lysinibacillus xylanilyticus]|uniref:hypothetical protein n=1 Tax=Lysinibacillus xylanilyticus TaxID=582475 RepID=UPI0012FE5E89|nr:hypothetical protein [Lysinibacillus xylanilyticus]
MIQSPPSESMVIKTLFEISGITKEKITSELRELISETARPEILFFKWEYLNVSRVRN